MTLVGDEAAARRHVHGMADRTWVIVRNLNREWTLRTREAAEAPNTRTASRRVEERSILPAQTVRHHPLAPSLEEGLRVGPVPLPLLIGDDREVLFCGYGRAATHELLSWASSDPEVVAMAVTAFDELWETSAPPEALGLPGPLTDRLLGVALGLADGLTDREIAQTLGVSDRTVSSDVRALVDWVGARNRAHAVAKIVGAG